MKDKIFIALQYLAPQHLLTNIVGKVADSEIPIVKNTFIKVFTYLYDIDMQDAINPDPYSYKSFNDFFIRKLKADARQISSNDDIISPSDGVISQVGDISSGNIFQAKDMYFSVGSLLGTDGYNHVFANGKFTTIYLAPSDYHRVHMPLTGKLLEYNHISGSLFSVNNVTANNVPNLFASNERVSFIFDTKIGKVALVMVGAMIVGSIGTEFAGIIKSSSLKPSVTKNNNLQDLLLDKASELGFFKLGSTVIMLFENSIIWDQSLQQGSRVYMGKPIATLKEHVSCRTVIEPVVSHGCIGGFKMSYFL